MPLSAELNSASALSRSLLSVRNNDGRIVGLAFLVTDTVAFTCAHVINTATGRSRTEDATGATVELEPVFGPSEGTVVEATVEHWSAATSPRQAADDISVLRLQHSVEATEPVRLQNPSGLHGEAQVRVFGMPAGRPQGVWHAGTLKGMVASGWIQINQSADIGYRIEQGFSGGPVWDEAQRAVVGMITVADLGEVRAAYAIPAPSLIAALPALRDELRQPSPYPGLIPYPETMRDAFLGRGLETRAVANLLDQERWVTISGPSGSGKSSLLLAGIVPLLRDCGDQVTVVRPGEDDWSSMANHLGGQAHENRTVVAIDQLEELFTLDEEGQDSFIQTLFGDRLSSRVRVVSTLRHDFLGLALAHPVLRRAVQGQRMYPLGPLQEEGLRAVVTRGGARVSVPRYEDGLADRIVADARDSAAPMPLLSHTLAALWDGSPGSILTHRAYDEVGGVGGALDQAVRRWLDEVPIDLEGHLPHLLAKLVRLPSDAAEPTRRVINATALPEQERKLAQRLTTAGLLVAGGSLDPADWAEDAGERAVSVELAHDSLFRIWGLLADFVKDNRSFLAWSERLRFDAERWADGDPARTELLPSEAELDAAARWEQERGDDLTPVQRAYLAAGQAARTARARRRHWVLGSAAIVAALFLVLATVLIASGATSAEQRQRSASRVLADNAAELKSTDPSLGILAGVAAWQTAPTDEARDRLLSEYADYPGIGYARVLPTGLGTPDWMAHSADGDVVAVLSAFGRLTLEVNVLSGTIRTADITDLSRIRYVAVSGDGSRVVALREDGAAFWFAIDRSAPSLHGPVHTLQNARDRAPAPADGSGTSSWSWDQFPLISPDGRYAVAGAEGRIVRWDLGSGGITNVALDSGYTLFNSYLWPASPDAATLLMPVVLGSDKKHSDVVELNLKTGRNRVVARGGDDWLPGGDGQILIRCRQNGSTVEYSRFRVADGVQIGKPVGYHINGCLMEGTDRTGRFLLAEAEGGGLDGEAVIDFDKGAVTSDFAVPEGWLGATGGETLAERGGKYYQLGVPNSGPAGYVAVPTSAGPSIGSVDVPFASQLLLGRGTRSVSITDQTTSGGTSADELLQLRSTQYPDHLITQTEVRIPGWTLGGRDGPRAAPRGDLIADREGQNVVVIRDTATLRKRAAVHTGRPPDNNGPELALVRDLTGNSGATAAYGDDWFCYFFDSAGNLVTVSGEVVQIWQARTGREITRLDLSKTRPPGTGNALPSVAPSSSPETVMVTYPGTPSTAVINVSSGKTLGNLPTGPLTVSVQPDPSGKYLLLYRQDHTVEVRDSRARRTILGPVPAGDDDQFVARFLGSDRFLLGANNSVQVYDLRSGTQTDSFRFGGQASPGFTGPADPLGTVRAVSSDGERVIYQRNQGPPLVIPLDAGQWQRALCAVAGYRRLGGELDYLTPGTRIRRDVCRQVGS